MFLKKHTFLKDQSVRIQSVETAISDLASKALKLNDLKLKP